MGWDSLLYLLHLDCFASIALTRPAMCHLSFVFQRHIRQCVIVIPPCSVQLAPSAPLWTHAYWFGLRCSFLQTLSDGTRPAPMSLTVYRRGFCRQVFTVIEGTGAVLGVLLPLVAAHGDCCLLWCTGAESVMVLCQYCGNNKLVSPAA